MYPKKYDVESYIPRIWINEFPYDIILHFFLIWRKKSTEKWNSHHRNLLKQLCMLDGFCWTNERLMIEMEMPHFTALVKLHCCVLKIISFSKKKPLNIFGRLWVIYKMLDSIYCGLQGSQWKSRLKYKLIYFYKSIYITLSLSGHSLTLYLSLFPLALFFSR